MVEAGRARVRGRAGNAAAATARAPDAPSRFIHMSAFDDGLVLVLHPADDRAFVEWAGKMPGALVVHPADLQALLRERYPTAVVRPRELAGERAEVWYVYRDGRWVARPAPRPASGAG